MSLIQANLPNALTPPSNPTDPASQNNDATSSNFRRANQPWVIKVAQTINPHSLGNNAQQLLGFDTVLFNTYKALQTSSYALNYANAVINGNDYPYTTIIAPQYGYYHVDWLVAVVVVGGAGDQFFYSSLFVNNVEIVTGHLDQIKLPTSSQYMSSLGSDYILLNPGDMVQVKGLISNSAIAAPATTDNIASTFRLAVRYEGLT